jgi:hypothetical protein
MGPINGSKKGSGENRSTSESRMPGDCQAEGSSERAPANPHKFAEPTIRSLLQLLLSFSFPLPHPSILL